MALRKTQRGKYSVYMNLGEVTSGELETLRAETRRLAKQANQRMVRLEKESRFGTGPAYKRARDDLRTEFGAPRNRYRESLRTATREELIAEYKSLREFITSKSSTVAGYTDIIEKRWKSFKEQTGSDISIEDYVEAWEKITADAKTKETYYKSQFRLIKEAAAEYQDARLRAEAQGEPFEGSFDEIMSAKLETWKGQDYIKALAQDMETIKGKR